MYAVFKTGGKQYRATKGDRLKLEKLDAEEGAAVEFDQVLLVGEGTDVKIGSPLVAGGKVKAKVLTQGKSKKVRVVKFKRRQNYLRQHGHRQQITEVEITSITGAKSTKAKAPEAEAVEAKAPATPKKAAATKPAAKKKATAKKAPAKKAPAKKASDDKDSDE